MKRLVLIAATLALATPAMAQTADSILASINAAKRNAVCLNGFVWREAGYGADDLVCVPPPARDRVRGENALAAQRRAGSGPYGPDTCKPGFVWREAFANDRVCVPPASRDLVKQENALGPSRRVKR